MHNPARTHPLWFFMIGLSFHDATRIRSCFLARESVCRGTELGEKSTVTGRLLNGSDGVKAFFVYCNLVGVYQAFCGVPCGETGCHEIGVELPRSTNSHV